jgi:flavodoxin
MRPRLRDSLGHIFDRQALRRGADPDELLAFSPARRGKRHAADRGPKPLVLLEPACRAGPFGDQREDHVRSTVTDSLLHLDLRLTAFYNSPMKTLVIYSSKHHMNTERIALAMGAELGAEVKKLADVQPQDLEGFDLVGFGSGINGFNVHPELTALIGGLPERKGQKAFVFSTCASNKDWTEKLRTLLSGKGFSVVGEFHCPGLWTPLFFRIRRGHPDATDIESARAFARNLRQ